jgi:arabinofuranan 3-O-arabinosyltransferase
MAGRRSARRPGWPRVWLLACCVLLAGLPFATAPGAIIADTKFELAVDPHGFLSGALTLWNPQQFGGLTNQYVGYLFPMGPFFDLVRALGTAGWITQRLWLAALLLAGFAGTLRLAARLAIGTTATRLAGGLAYALSPMALSIAGQTSAELLPMVMVPWMIIPLTDLRPWYGSARRCTAGRSRAVAQSALAIAFCSGTNAASTLAALVPCALYILTRPGTRTKARLLAWWLPAAMLVSVSWSVPLLLLAKYGVSFVPYTESLQVTASTTSLTAIIRGVETWIGYQATNGQPNRPVAFYLATGALPALLTAALAALGLAGLVHRALPERRFLLWTVIGGIAAVSLGYVSGLGNPLANQLIALLNGPASPLRNLWKFDPMIRLPLALGLAHVLTRPRPARARAVLPWTRTTEAPTALWAATVAALAGLAVPAAVFGLASPGSFSQVPGYWTAAADWLNVHAGRQAVLVEPGAGFGVYTWGSPMDDVLSALTNADFAERNLGVIGSIGNERLLTAIDQDIAAGDGSSGLTQVMARMGIKYVLVRNDLASSQAAGTYAARVHNALADSPGITLAAQFGPDAGGGTPDDAVADFSTPYPAVQIYRVAGPEPAAVVQPAAGTVRVIGAPESLITLADEGLLGNSPVLLDSDGTGQPVAGMMVTDSLRRRTVNFGQIRQDYSPTLTAADPADTFLSANDFTEPGWSSDQAVAQYIGITNVTASSSAADITASAAQWATAMLPYAALDGNANTMWETGAFNGPLGQWIQANFDTAVPFGQGAAARIQVAFTDSIVVGPPVTRVTVSTAAGTVSDPVRVTGDPQYLRVPTGPSGWLRITITGLERNSAAVSLGTQAGITSIVVPGVAASRTIVAPAVPAGASATVVLSKAQPYQSACMRTTLRWVCSSGLTNPGEEQYGFDHTVVEPAPQPALLSGTAILTDPSMIAHYALDWPSEPTISGTSTGTDAPQDQPWDAFDGNPATTWVASPGDPAPQLSISWKRRRTISRLTIERPPGASGLMQVVITGDDGQRRGAMVGPSGVAAFPAMKTTSVHLTFLTYQSPLQVSEVHIPGVQPLAAATPVISLHCGLGPAVTVGGVTVPTKLTGSYADLLNGRPLQFTGCEPTILARGATRVTESASDAFDVQDIVLKPADQASTAAQPLVSAAPPVAATVLSWTSSKRTLRVSAATRSYLEVNENFNAGWRAVLDGRPLTPVELGGWKQAWVLPAGVHGTVTLTYLPAATYRDAIIAGFVILALCAGIALPVRRRRRMPPASGEPLAPGPARQPVRPRPAQPGRRSWWRHPLAVLVKVMVLAGAGLLLGGYPGAVLLPATAALMLRVPVLGPRVWPRLAGWLFVAAAVMAAVGERLLFAGRGGLSVRVLSDTAPQVVCLVVAGVLAAALLDAHRDGYPPAR